MIRDGRDEAVDVVLLTEVQVIETRDLLTHGHQTRELRLQHGAVRIGRISARRGACLDGDRTDR